MANLNVKKGDLVQVLSGKDKGKKATILRAFPAKNKVVVEGVAIVKKATRPNPMNQAGGIVAQEAAIDASNVALVCPTCDRGVRVGHKFVDGKKVRYCKKCGNVI